MRCGDSIIIKGGTFCHLAIADPAAQASKWLLPLLQVIPNDFIFNKCE